MLLQDMDLLQAAGLEESPVFSQSSHSPKEWSWGFQAAARGAGITPTTVVRRFRGPAHLGLQELS